MLHQRRLSAVFNGGDVDPMADPHFPSDGYTNYSERMVPPELLARMRQNKRAFIGEVRAASGGRFQATEEDFIIGSFGRISTQKGLDVLEQAFRRVAMLPPSGKGRVKL